MGKKIIRLIALLCLVLIIVSGCGKKADEVQQINIGAVLAVTGTQAPFNEPIIKAIKMAQEEINNAGGINGKKLNVIIEDSKGEPQGGVAAFNKLVDVDKVPAIIGSSSPVIAATLPIAEKKGVVLLDISTVSPKIWEGERHVSFSIYPKANIEMVEQARFVYNTLGLKTAAVLAINSETGQSSGTMFSDEFVKLGGKIVSSERYPANTVQFQDVLSRVAAAKPEIVTLIGNEEAATVVRQAREAGFKFQFITYSAGVNDKFLQSAGNTCEGVMATTVGWNPEDPSEVVQKFIAAYKNKYNNENPIVYAATGYDAVYILTNVLKNTEATSSAIAAAMYKVEFAGASGVTKIGSDGLAPKQVYIKIVKDGKWTSYK